MHRSSESIGAIAAALARAQTELVNPEKALVGVIRSQNPNESDHSFHYASLSSGLDLVRKTLGRHEIATVQTTSIDLDAGLIRLTSVLAHSSGEWMSSDWPVCPIGETASPRRMGAALTYARRYALFTLVGIAGEDDRDAPDTEINRSISATSRVANGVNDQPMPPIPARSKTKASPRVSSPLLRAEESATLRDQLYSQLAQLASADALMVWAGQSLPLKNSLTRADAEVLEKAFEAKLGDVQGTAEPAAEPRVEVAATRTLEVRAPDLPQKPERSLAKTCRRRDKRHLEYVASKPCLVSGRTPTDAHHLRFAEPRALGRKVSDEFTVPLCRTHHRHLHARGDERAWWNDAQISPEPIAQRLWSETR